MGRTEGDHATIARPGYQHTTRHHVFASRVMLCRRRATARTAAIRTRPRPHYPAPYICANDGGGIGRRHRRAAPRAIQIAAPRCPVSVMFLTFRSRTDETQQLAVTSLAHSFNVHPWPPPSYY